MPKEVKLVKLFTLFLVAGFVSLGSAMAQDSEVSDEKLQAYVVVMDSVDVLRTTLSESVSEMIKSHEMMDGGRVYNKIKLAQGDTVKLAEEGITEEQLAAYDEIKEEVAELQAELNETFSEMVKEQVGIADYNKIRKGLRSDAELKERYKELMAERKAQNEEVEEDGGTAKAPQKNGSPE